MEKSQLAGLIFLNNLEGMKATLELLEFKLGKKSEDYLYAKKKIMDCIYKGLEKLFRKLEEQNLIVKCSKHKTLRRGYQKCECMGSSYINKKDNKKK